MDEEPLWNCSIIHHLISVSAPLRQHFTKEALNLDDGNFTPQIFQDTLLVLTA